MSISLLVRSSRCMGESHKDVRAWSLVFPLCVRSLPHIDTDTRARYPLHITYADLRAAPQQDGQLSSLKDLGSWCMDLGRFYATLRRLACNHCES